MLHHVLARCSTCSYSYLSSCPSDFCTSWCTFASFPVRPTAQDCDGSGTVLPERRSRTTSRGKVLADFLEDDDAQEAQLEPAHVAALRLYTSAAYKSINEGLRDQERFRDRRPHPLSTTVAFIDEGAKKLRRVSANRPHAHESLPLYRGMRDVTMPEAFLRGGGTEVSPHRKRTYWNAQ